MRTESRFLATDIKFDLLEESFLKVVPHFKYRVTNYYLDDPTGRYSKKTFGSPRLRVRMYEGGQFCFGNIELKSHVTESVTQKEIYSLSAHWSEVAYVIPQLALKKILYPPAGSVFQCLVARAGDEKDGLCLTDIKWFATLSYVRVSCGTRELRLNVDSEFEPAIMSERSAIIEVKGNNHDALLSVLKRCFTLIPLKGSKFSLLMS